MSMVLDLLTFYIEKKDSPLGNTPYLSVKQVKLLCKSHKNLVYWKYSKLRFYFDIDLTSAYRRRFDQPFRSLSMTEFFLRKKNCQICDRMPQQSIYRSIFKLVDYRSSIHPTLGNWSRDDI